MENAADALKIAFGVLIFVMALSISILSFGEARRTADIIISYQDREKDYIYYEYDPQNGKNRTVSVETIVPSLYRLKAERYRIVFNFKDSGNTPVYTLIKRVGTQTEKEKITSIDLTNLTAEQADQYNEFMEGIIYHKFQTSQTDFEKKFSVQLPMQSFYDRIKGAKFEEQLGVYSQSGSDVPEVQKDYKRVITYTRK